MNETLREKKARLEKELEDLRLKAQIKDLERQIELERAQCHSKDSQYISSTPSQKTQTSAQTPVLCNSRLIERAGSPTCETIIKLRDNDDTPPSSTNLEVCQKEHSSSSPGVQASSSACKEPSYNLTSPGRVDSFLESAKCTESQSNRSTDDWTLWYYQEIEENPDNDAQLVFYDMDLDELYGLATASADNPENQIGQAEFLSSIYYFIFSRTGAVDDLQKAIEAIELVTGTYTEEPHYARCLRNLVVMLMKKYECTHSLEDIDRAITQAEVMLTTTHHAHPDWVLRYRDTYVMMHQRYLQTRSPDDERNVLAMGIDGLFIAHVIERDSDLAQIKIERTGDLNELQMAIMRCEEALAETPHDRQAKAYQLHKLATLSGNKFEETDDIDDLQIAILKSEEAIAVVPYNHPRRAALVYTFAFSLLFRFIRTGDVNDLQRAITGFTEAAAVSPQNHPERAEVLGSLAYGLTTRFERIGDLNDLHLAIAHLKEALEIGPHDNSDRTLYRLICCYVTRFKRTHNIDDLQIATTYCEEGLAATPAGHRNRALMLNVHSICLGMRFKHTGNIDDFHLAVAKAEEGIAENPRSIPLLNLASLYLPRYWQTHSVDDLAKTIERSENALAVMDLEPKNVSVRAKALRMHAFYLQLWALWHGKADDSDRAARLWVEVAESLDAPPSDRIGSAMLAARILINHKKWTDISRITDIAVNLLPAVAPQQLRQGDQQHIIGQFAGLAALAASAALEVGKDACHAVQLLELGRGIITGLRLGTRSDLAELKDKHKGMAEKFERVRDVLNSDLLGSDSLDFDAIDRGSLASVSNANRRHKANSQFDEIVNDIRRLSGFEDFLRPQQAHELMAAASLGPVVVINVSDHRCDAILIGTEVIQSLRLPDLHHTDIEEQVKLLAAARSHAISSDKRSQMSRMLEWLWEAAVRPVLNALGFLDIPSNGDLPRVWWIPTGALSLLPLHAAGRPFPQSMESALDRVISTYSPSIKALLHARQNSHKSPSFESGEALLVSMSTTPGHFNLPFAEEEVDKLSEILPDSVQKVLLQRPCRKELLKNLATCTLFHYAGHGESHPSDPSQSSLLLKDWETDPLTVEHLFGLDLSRKPPWLAYLSACSTGESRAPKLYDEAINLVSVCQLAGFQHVVGSLWEISDRYSVDAAAEVYKTIREGGTFSGERIALGVHRAAKLLRDRMNQRSQVRSAEVPRSKEEELAEARRGKRVVRPYGYHSSEDEIDDPFVWAGYIHVGP
ncbi:CHAT domain-containing protein [Xylaria venustula]|nr:CHAT domain-containing protein [Xylaria venustula]